MTGDIHSHKRHNVYTLLLLSIYPYPPPTSTCKHKHKHEHALTVCEDGAVEAAGDGLCACLQDAIHVLLARLGAQHRVESTVKLLARLGIEHGERGGVVH